VILLLCLGALSYPSAFLPPKAPHRDMLSAITSGFQAGDRIWYNMGQGALGSSIQYDVDYYLSREGTAFSSDTFVWDAPNDFRDTNAVPRV
jgi:hypothetical protein